MSFRGCLAALLALASGTSEALPAGPDDALFDVGWGNADTYHTASIELVDHAAKRGLRFVVTEDRPTVQAKDWRQGQVPSRFPAVAGEINRLACRNGQIHVVFWINWNVEPIRDLSDAWAARDFDRVLEIYDPACTWLEPVVEPDEGDVAKAERWTKMAAERWPGVVILPSAGAHWPIRRDAVDHHPGSLREAEIHLERADERSIVITDGGPFSHPPDVLGDLPRLARLALDQGVPFIVYTDRYAPGDVAAQKSVIDAVAQGIPPERRPSRTKDVRKLRMSLFPVEVAR